MTDQELEQHLRAWYNAQVPAELPAPAELKARVVAIPRTTAGTSRWSARSRRGVTLLAAAALVGLLAGTAWVGGFVGPSPDRSVVPPSEAPSLEPSAQPPSAAPSVVPGASGLIAYAQFVPLDAVGGDCEHHARPFFPGQRPTGCSRLWVSNPDGTDAHELLPEQPGYQTPIAWTPDGTGVLYEDAVGLWLTDPSGTVLWSMPWGPLCGEASPCRGYSFSPDGTKLAFEHQIPTSEASGIATVELTTGQISELGSTRSSGPAGDSGSNDPPQWSPDGTRLAFSRQGIGAQGEAATYVVGVDGTNLHQLVPTDLQAIGPRWSPDGSLIAFLSADYDDGAGDIYVVNQDGTDVRRLTDDSRSFVPEWTADGRLVFSRIAGNPGFELWIMDADGANEARLNVEDVTELSAAGCLICPWVRNPESPTRETEYMVSALWRPTP